MFWVKEIISSHIRSLLLLTIYNVIYISAICPEYQLLSGCPSTLSRSSSVSSATMPASVCLANVLIGPAYVRCRQYKSLAAGGAELASVPVSAGAEFCISSFGASPDQVLRRLAACSGSVIRDRIASKGPDGKSTRRADFHSRRGMSRSHYRNRPSILPI